MNKASPTLAHGFTLIEMTVVLLIMTLLAGVAIRETNSLSFQVRYEQTRERLERIREAILGNPRQIINGQQAVSGFVADMGRLPGSIKELIQLSSYCSDATKLTKADCENTLGAVWFGRKSYGFCNLNYPNETQCLANSGSWTHLFYGGWNGPYLNISGNSADSDAFTDGWGRLAQGYCSDISYTSQTACTTNGATWTPLAGDNNYGWYYDTASYANSLRIQSYGKDHVYAGSDYDADYPALETQSVVQSQDWLVDISGGIEVSLLKPNSAAIPIVSFCTDPSKTTKADCEVIDPVTSAPYGNWIGGCNESGFINKGSCTAPKKWFSCNINTLDDSDAGFAACTAPNCYKTKPTCEQANGVWFGQGYGCSDQAKSSKINCAGTDVWRSCSDDGTITTQSACDTANENWYGDNIVLNDINSVGIRRFRKRDICLKLFYRDPNTSTVTNIPSNNYFTIDENGAYQTIRFNFTTPPIPIGQNAIGIYEHDGTCTSTLYPADRQNPIQVDFYPRAGLPVINW